nr:Ig-like domain-containing protein [uncultured Roseateles sp.]
MSAFTGVTRFLAGAVILLGSLTLTACGGGGAAGDPILGGGPGTGTTIVTADLSLTIDKVTVPNTGAEEATVTITALDASRNVVGGAPVAVTVDNNAFVTPSGTTTATGTGQITAKVAIGSDKSNRAITLTARSGTITKTVSFEVVDSISGSKTSDLVVTLDKPNLTNSGTDSVNVSVTALDTSRKALGGVPVSFSVDASAVVTPEGGKTSTDATSGQIKAAVTIGALKTKRSITVTVNSGTVTRSISFDVVDAVVTIPRAADLTVVLSSNSIQDSGLEEVVVTATAVDASRNALAGIPVAFTVDQNAVLIASSASTNAQGQVTARVLIGSDRTNRRVTVTATSDTLVRTAAFQVSGAKLTGTADPTVMNVGDGGKVEYKLRDVNNNGLAQVPITITGPGSLITNAVTDDNGTYLFSYTAPAAAGSYDIKANSGGAPVNLQTILVSTGSIPAATGPVVSAALSLESNVVKVNTVGNANRIDVRALFLGNNNKAIKDVRVRFKVDPTNAVGGTFSIGAGTSYSDINGVATTAYIPGSRSSPTDGLRLRACYDLIDFPDFADDAPCPGTSKEISVKLTVVSEALSVTIGTNETIEVGPSNLTYIQKFVLLVVDSAGNAMPNVQITPSIDLLAYGKGFYTWNAAQSAWIPTVTARCLSEDVNRNGSVDAGEDINGNGSLDPRKSDAAISMVGSTKTDANGSAILKVEYPKSHASWVSFKISAAAFGVLSPPAVYSGLLPADAKAIKTETPPPAFVVSPYGIVGSCTDPN